MHKTTFSKFPLRSELLSVLSELNFEQMTPIQELSLPLLLEGRDCIGKSKTGSGKTTAFALPILQKLDLENRNVQALIICPTRELGQQVTKEIRRLGRKYDGLQVLLVSGGQPLREQSFALRRGVHIVVGTPGRLLDLLYKQELDLLDMKTLVLDEADKMLEMGFQEDIQALIDSTPQVRQTVLFSATFPKEIEKLSAKYQVNPQMVSIEEDESHFSTIEQYAYDCGDEDKMNILLRVLQQHPARSTLIFCNQKIVADDLVQILSDKGASCLALHGNLEQRDRDLVMALFRNESVKILVATDVAARGLDIDHLDLVVNYDFPLHAETYTHRIGRTGRAGKSGVAVSLVSKYEVLDLIQYAEERKSKILQPKLGFQNQYGLPAEVFFASKKTIMISAGRKEKLRPGDILGALTGPDVQLAFADIGKIEIQDHVSYVAIASAKAKTAFNKLSNSKIKGQKYYLKLININP